MRTTLSAKSWTRSCIWLTLFLALVFTPLAGAREPNTLSPEEKRLEFRLLFNGKDLAGWKHGGNWIAQDGAIRRHAKGGNLVYRESKVPDDFELRFEWKVAAGSNSGIYYRPTQYEYQILDNAEHRDGRNPRTSAASLYFCMPPSQDTTVKPGTWNTGRVVCKGTVIQHWLNGKKVVDFDYADPRWKDNVKLLQWRGGDLTARGAHLLLQDHGDPVAYRSLRIRSIPEDEELISENIVPQELTAAERDVEREKIKSITERRQKRKNSNNK